MIKKWYKSVENAERDSNKNAERDRYLKQIAQRAFEDKIGTREDFIKAFGKSYL